MQVQSLGWENPMEEGMATLFSILAWRIPWTGRGSPRPEQPLGRGSALSRLCAELELRRSG